ncbi:CRISPR-associated protein, Cmr1 family [Solimonas aquatica]|uniref:CRISPR-associated protein, Cmr1 family n=1 Tax=Solimonas aquatica TaxID=489703 RepID=A0A1H9M8V0_9GAMM|nr:RAMP superfamily CRISPR-associated protein [Solimonas aquatica]SER20146.1 CRISPR-associated protein, Cmr1 family [Solimonas aquatica]
MRDLKLDFQVLTPLFLGDAEQSAELRAPAFKGLLRHWYRAASPDDINKEACLFGGTSNAEGQSPFLLRVESVSIRTAGWADFRAAQFNQGSGRNTRNGLVYLGYPFQMKGNETRTAIAPGQAFVLRCTYLRDVAQEQGRALLAAAWLFAHLGGAGTRSRRGFGSLSLRSWNAEDWPDAAQLPLLTEAKSAEEGRAMIQSGIDTIRSWFKPVENVNQQRTQAPHLGPEFRFKLLDKPYPAEQWNRALAEMGAGMQAFRLRRPPDYQMVKDHLQGRPLQTTPPRATFGLPLSFRYTSQRGQVTLAPLDAERHGSLLLLRLLRIGARLYPLYVRMDGAVPGVDPPAALLKASRGLRRTEHNVMDEFFDSL